MAEHGQFTPGEQILLKRNTTCKGQLTTTGSGTTSAPILLGAYGTGSRPLVNGSGTANQTGAVELRNQQYWTIQDLRITNTAGGRSSKYYRSGLLIQNSTGGRLAGITVQRLDVRSVASNMSNSGSDARQWGGITAITLANAKSSGFDNLTIRNNTVVKVGRTGIMVTNYNYPQSHDTSDRVSANKVDQSRGDGIVVRGTTSSRIDHNVVSHANSEWPCAECGPITPVTANAAIWTATSKNTLIDHNEAYGTKWPGGDGEGFDIDASAVGTVVEYNYAHDNAGGGILFCGSVNAIARFNILQNNKKSAFAFIGNMPAKNTKIYNNTVYNSKKSGAKVVRYFNGPQKTTVSFRNNLVFNYGASNYRWPGQKVTTSSNTLVGLLGTLRPHDSKTSFINPGLKSPGSGKNGISTLKGYKPKHPSTFKKGAAIPSSVKTDFFGKKINPKHPPRGAAA